MPLVSVIMSVHNGAKYLKPSIESILNQTFQDFEFLITDDGSTDNSVEIIRKYSQQDSRIILCINEEKIGLPKSLNNMISICKGEYLLRMDADDIAFLDRIQKQVDLVLLNRDLDVVYGDTLLIDINGDEICKAWRPKTDMVLKWMPYYSFIGHPTVILKKSKIIEVGGYNEKFLRAQDWELWNRMISNNSIFYHLNEELVKYRINLGNNRMYPRRSIGYKMAMICIINKQKLMSLKYLKRLSLSEWTRIAIFLLLPHFIMIRLKIMRRKKTGYHKDLIKEVENY